MVPPAVVPDAGVMCPKKSAAPPEEFLGRDCSLTRVCSRTPPVNNIFENMLCTQRVSPQLVTVHGKMKDDITHRLAGVRSTSLHESRVKKTTTQGQHRWTCLDTTTPLTHVDHTAHACGPPLHLDAHRRFASKAMRRSSKIVTISCCRPRDESATLNRYTSPVVRISRISSSVINVAL